MHFRRNDGICMGFTLAGLRKDALTQHTEVTITELLVLLSNCAAYHCATTLLHAHPIQKKLHPQQASALTELSESALRLSRQPRGRPILAQYFAQCAYP